MAPSLLVPGSGTLLSAEGFAELLRELDPLPHRPPTLLGTADSQDNTTAEAGDIASDIHNTTAITRPASTPPKRRKRQCSATASTDARRSRHRERERRELMYLRASCEMLTRELDDLRRQQQERNQAKRTIADNEMAQASMWRVLALRTRLERQETENENKQLKALAASQLQFAAAMFQMQQAVPRTPIGTRQPDRAYLDLEDAGVLEAFLVEMDQLEAQADSVVDHTLQVLATEGSNRVIDWAVKPDGTRGGRVFDLYDKREIPLKFASVQQDYWRLVISVVAQRSGASYEPSQQQDLAMAVKFRVPCAWRDRQGFVDVNQVVASRHNGQRQVTVWRGLDIGEGAMTGLCCEEVGWSVLTPSPASADCCVLMTCVKRKPMVSSRRCGRGHAQLVLEPDFREFAQVMVDAGDRDMETFLAQFKNSPDESVQV